MAASAQPAKVLRIGIIQDGKIVQERLIKSGETVTVGESAKNTFVFPKTKLPRAEFPVFVHRGGAYHLAFTEHMRGKVSSSGAVVGLDKLRSDPSVQSSGGVWKLPLTERDRGKITIGNVTILFQFVQPPPQQAVKPIQAMDFRPRLLEADDPIFLGFLAIFTALAAVLVIYVANTEPRPVNSLAQIPDRFTKIIMEEPDEPDEPDQPDEPDPNQTAEVATPGQDQVAPEPTDSQPAPTTAESREDLRNTVAESNAMIAQLMGTTGQGSSGIFGGVIGDGTGLDDIEFGGPGIDTTANTSQGPRTSQSGTAEDVEIGEVGPGTAAQAGPIETAQVEISGTVAADGDGEVDVIEGDAAAVRMTVKRGSGQLKYCYEKRLKVIPTLEGRVEVEWTVEAGEVQSVAILANETGDSELAACIKGKIRRWSFPDDLEGTFSWPWVFRPSN